MSNIVISWSNTPWPAVVGGVRPGNNYISHDIYIMSAFISQGVFVDGQDNE